MALEDVAYTKIMPLYLDSQTMLMSSVSNKYFISRKDVVLNGHVREYSPIS